MADKKKRSTTAFDKRVRCTIYVNCTAMLIYANQCQLHNYYLKYCLYVNTILGPVVFNLYVNDLPDTIKPSHVAMFVDDTKLFKNIRSVRDSESFKAILDT